MKMYHNQHQLSQTHEDSLSSSQIDLESAVQGIAEDFWRGNSQECAPPFPQMPMLQQVSEKEPERFKKFYYVLLLRRNLHLCFDNAYTQDLCYEYPFK